MDALVRKSVPYLFSRYGSLPLSLHLFSTLRKWQPVTTSTVLDLLLHEHQFSPEVVSQVASVLSRAKNPENSYSILSFLKESGFSNAQLEKIVKYRPRFLLASLDDSIRPKLKVFQGLGFSSKDVAKIISSNPSILQLNLSTRVLPSLSVLEGLLGSYDDVAKLLRRSGWFLIRDLEMTMVPNIEFLKACGIPMDRILRLLYNHPRCLLLKPGIMRKSVEKAVETGADPTSNMFIYALRIVASLTNQSWELKLQAFRNCGFSEDDIVTMFRKAPQVFASSAEKIKKTKEVLLATGKYNMSCIDSNPMSLACSIEKRYKERFKILGILESRNLIIDWPNLKTIYTMTDEKFFEKFVSPYLREVGESYIAKLSARGNGEKEIKASA